MPTYEFKCETCGYNFELTLRLSDEHPTICEECGAPIHQVYYAPMARVLGDPKTVGSLAEQNSKKMSQEEKAALDAQYKASKAEAASRLSPGMSLLEKPEKPWYKKKSTTTTQEILKMNDGQKKRYIMEGKK